MQWIQLPGIPLFKNDNDWLIKFPVSLEVASSSSKEIEKYYVNHACCIITNPEFTLTSLKSQICTLWYLINILHIVQFWRS